MPLGQGKGMGEHLSILLQAKTEKLPQLMERAARRKPLEVLSPDGEEAYRSRRRLLQQVWHGQPERQQVLLWLREFSSVTGVRVLQPGQPALREVLRLLRTKTQSNRIEALEHLTQFSVRWVAHARSEGAAPGIGI